jgi:PleD family two-component response regulator
MPYRIHADTNGSAVVVIVETANEALAKMAELIELGCSDVVTKDLDGRLVDQARLETEAASHTR